MGNGNRCHPHSWCRVISCCWKRATTSRQTSGLLEAANLRIEEAALTGESVPVQKDANIRLEADIPLGDRKNTTFMGTLVSYGRGRGVVVSTGMRTQIGLIAEMLQAVENEPTPLQKRLDQLGKIAGMGNPGHLWGGVCGVYRALYRPRA